MRRAFLCLLPGVVVCSATAHVSAARAQPPLQPRVFAPGVISSADTYELNGTFSPDGRAFYFTRCARGENRPRDCRIVVSEWRDSAWRAARAVPFSAEYEDMDPSLSPDGQRLVFLSRRPLPGTGAPRPDWNIWFSERAGAGSFAWSEPRPAGPTINSDSSELFASFGPRGDLFFGSLRPGGTGLGDLYVAAPGAGGFGQARSLGPGINSSVFESDPQISADGRFLTFTSFGRPTGSGSGDIYLSYNADGRWLAPEPLDDVNTEARECCGTLGPDGKTFYFAREMNGQTDLLHVSAAAIGIPVLPTGPRLPPPPDSVGVEHIGGNVFAFSFHARPNRMNVAASIGADGIVLVDYQPPTVADTLAAMLAQRGSGNVRYLLNTHWHQDHTGGNARFGPHVPIVAHERVRTRLMRYQTPSWSPTGVARLPAYAWPTLTFTDSVVIRANGERILMFHPGVAHTDGDAVVLFEQSGVAAMGDLFSGRGEPSGDDWYSGDPIGYEVALRRIAGRLPPGTRLITGHGRIASVAELHEYIDLYAALLAFVRAVPPATPDSALIVPAVLEAQWSAWRMPEGYVRRIAAAIKGGLRRTGEATRRLDNSGGETAQQDFSLGLTALHNFQYAEAARHFREAQRADSAFALAYWGEALTHHRPLWNHHDPVAARRVLERLALTPEERAHRAPRLIEQSLIRAADALFAGNDRQAANQEFARHVGRIVLLDTADADLAALHGLSVLATAAAGEAGAATRMRSAAILEAVLARSPRHPGVNHYLIHAYDDPVHAPLGQRSAHVYARLAPRSPHAQHMPSHIFFQLGRWEDATRANEAAWRASVGDQIANGGGVEQRDYHSLMWLGYSLLQEGKRSRAMDVRNELADAARGSGAAPVQIAFGTVEALLALEGVGALPEPERARVGAAATQANLLTAIGIAAFRAGDSAHLAAVQSAMDTLTPYVGERDTPLVTLMRLMLRGAGHFLRGERDAALRELAEAVRQEARLPLPSGVPSPLVPAHEFFADLLLQAGRPGEAATAFARALERTPGRSVALLGRARSLYQSGDRVEARNVYRALAEGWRAADASLPALREVRAAGREPVPGR